MNWTGTLDQQNRTHYLGKFDASLTALPNPMVRLHAVDETAFHPSWRKGYTFYPVDKEKREDGTILLTYRGEINNRTLSLDLYDIDFASCRKESGHWVVMDLETGRTSRIECPRVTLDKNNLTVFPTHYPHVYPSYPRGKNQQPDGRVILSAGVDIEDHAFGVILPADVDFRRIRIIDDQFFVPVRQ